MIASIVRQFVAIYGQEAYERLCLRADSPESLALALTKAVEGPSRLNLECINMSKELTKIVVKWAGGKPVASDATHIFDAAMLGPTVARQRAEARVAIIKAYGGEAVLTEYYADGSFHTDTNI